MLQAYPGLTRLGIWPQTPVMSVLHPVHVPLSYNRISPGFIESLLLAGQQDHRNSPSVTQTIQRSKASSLDVRGQTRLEHYLSERVTKLQNHDLLQGQTATILCYRTRVRSR